MTTTTNISRTTAIRIWSDETNRGTIIVSREETDGSGRDANYTLLATDDYAEACRAAFAAAETYHVEVIDET